MNVFIGRTGTFVASIDGIVSVLFLCDRLFFVIQLDLIKSFIADIVDVQVESTPKIRVALFGFSKWAASRFSLTIS